MKSIKSYIISLLLIGVIVCLIFLPNAIDLIPSQKVKIIVAVILFFLMLILMIFTTYKDIRKKEYTNNVFIVITDVVQISSYLVVGYIALVPYDVKNMELLFSKIDHRMFAMLVFASTILLQSYFKTEKFKKI